MSTSGRKLTDEELKKERYFRKVIAGCVLVIILLLVSALFGGGGEETSDADPVDVETGPAGDPKDETSETLYYDDGTVRQETVTGVYDNYTETFIYSYDTDGNSEGYVRIWEDDGTVIKTTHDADGYRTSVGYEGDDGSYVTTYEYEFDDDGGLVWSREYTEGFDSEGEVFVEWCEYDYEDQVPVTWSSDDMSGHTDYYYYIYDETYDYRDVYVITQKVELDGYTLLGEITYNEDGTAESSLEGGYMWVMHGDGLWPEKES